MDSKEFESVWIYVYSYRRADPECANPSGSVNFSARLEIGVNGFMPDLSTPSTTDDDVFCRRGRNVGVYSTTVKCTIQLARREESTRTGPGVAVCASVCS
jgi:hypothetical protein